MEEIVFLFVHDVFHHVIPHSPFWRKKTKLFDLILTHMYLKIVYMHVSLCVTVREKIWNKELAKIKYLLRN